MDYGFWNVDLDGFFFGEGERDFFDMFGGDIFVVVIFVRWNGFGGCFWGLSLRVVDGIWWWVVIWVLWWYGWVGLCFIDDGFFGSVDEGGCVIKVVVGLLKGVGFVWVWWERLGENF